MLLWGLRDTWKDKPKPTSEKERKTQKYEEPLITPLWFFQILNKKSYRKTPEEAENENFDI